MTNETILNLIGNLSEKEIIDFKIEKEKNQIRFEKLNQMKKLGYEYLSFDLNRIQIERLTKILTNKFMQTLLKDFPLFMTNFTNNTKVLVINKKLNNFWGRCWVKLKSIDYNINFLKLNCRNIKIIWYLVIHECLHFINFNHDSYFERLFFKYTGETSRGGHIHSTNYGKQTIILPLTKYTYQCLCGKQWNYNRILKGKHICKNCFYPLKLIKQRW